MSAVSNTLAQALNVYKGGFAAIDRVAFVHFIILAIITTPPNYKWQLWLEETFPSHPARVGSATTGKKQDEKASLSIPNTIAKFALDQSLGASFNTLWFIVMINLLRGESFSHIVTIAQTVSCVQSASIVSLLTALSFSGLLPDAHGWLQVLAYCHNLEPCHCAIRPENDGRRISRSNLGNVSQFDTDVISGSP